MKSSIFKQHPNLDNAFETADGQFFYTENSAKNHAKTLDNKLVKLLVNDQVVNEPAAKTNLLSEEAKKAADDKAAKEAAQKVADDKAAKEAAQKVADDKAAKEAQEAADDKAAKEAAQKVADDKAAKEAQEAADDKAAKEAPAAKKSTTKNGK